MDIVRPLAFVSIFSLAGIFSSSIAHAHEQPMPPRELEHKSEIIIAGKVVSTEFIRDESDKRGTTTYYRSIVQVESVKKGNLKLSDYIEIRSSELKWFPNVLKPDCMTPQITFSPCEQFEGHLERVKNSDPDKPAFTLVHWSGKKCIKGCKGKMPLKKGRVLECQR